MSKSYERELGMIHAKLSDISTDIKELKESHTKIADKVDLLEQWRMYIIGAGSGVAGFVAFIWYKLKGVFL